MAEISIEKPKTPKKWEVVNVSIKSSTQSKMKITT